jgi:hypothetical protein
MIEQTRKRRKNNNLALAVLPQISKSAVLSPAAMMAQTATTSSNKQRAPSAGVPFRIQLQRKLDFRYSFSKVMWEFLKSIKSPELRLAWAVAIIADALQILALPLFAEGGLSPANDALDILVAVVLIRLLGWHWAFLPSLLAEAIPGLDLFPTWTTAVFFVTRQITSYKEGEPEILPPGPAPARRS